MEELPIGLQVQPDESAARNWSLWSRHVYLTDQRLIIYENSRNCAVARLKHVSSVQSAPKVNGAQQNAGWVLLIIGAMVALLGAYELYAIQSFYAPQQTPTLMLVIGLAIAGIGLLLVLTAQRTELYVTLSSSERLHLAPRGYSDTKKLEELMSELGDALAHVGLGQESPATVDL